MLELWNFVHLIITHNLSHVIKFCRWRKTEIWRPELFFETITSRSPGVVSYADIIKIAGTLIKATFADLKKSEEWKTMHLNTILILFSDIMKILVYLERILHGLVKLIRRLNKLIRNFDAGTAKCQFWQWLSFMKYSNRNKT